MFRKSTVFTMFVAAFAAAMIVVSGASATAGKHGTKSFDSVTITDAAGDTYTITGTKHHFRIVLVWHNVPDPAANFSGTIASSQELGWSSDFKLTGTNTEGNPVVLRTDRLRSGTCTAFLVTAADIGGGPWSSDEVCTGRRH